MLGKFFHRKFFDMRSLRDNKFSVIFRPKPRISLLLLLIISFITLVAILESSSSNSLDSGTSTRVPNIYKNYRRMKEQAAIDFLDLKSLSLGSSRIQELPLCSKERENFVPCYNASASMLAEFKDGKEFYRHCKASRQGEREKCIVRPPKDYKIPLKWPAGRDIIWSGNVKITKDQFLSSGTMTKRLMLLEENQIAFHSEDGLIFDGVKAYSRQLAEMIGLDSDTEFLQAGVRTVLDIGCGFGSFGAHLVSLNMMPICIVEYEATGSQVQVTLERGLPAMIGSLVSKQLPYPILSFDMVHCAQCSIIWDQKDAMLLLEVDRVLKPGGFFVLTSPTVKSKGTSPGTKRISISKRVEEFSEKICWSFMAQQDETFIWQKTSNPRCYSSRKQTSMPLCEDEHEMVEYYRPLVSCISGTTSKRWLPIQNRSSTSEFSSAELEVYGIRPEDFFEDLQVWRSALKNYWSLLTPLIFSDHPKRPGDEDPLPPFNMVRNVMDMNARYGNLNAAFLEEAKLVWVMNVVPVNTPNTLPLILDRGFAGVFHDWCEPFPTYPRTYDMLHANGLLSHLSSQWCSFTDLFLEMDRILRPEGWVVLMDSLGAIEMARGLAVQVRWEARVIDLQNGSKDQRLLVCQKPFLKK